MALKTERIARLLASVAVVAALALPAAGCKTTGDDTTGSIGSPNAPRSDAEWRQSLDVWGKRYRDDTGDTEAALNYSRAL
ncbi:MAG TPA: hypothetical protein VGC38_06540, partial [Pseudolabrys sp.]